MIMVRKLKYLISVATLAFAHVPALSAPALDANALALDILKKSIAYRTVEGQGQVPVYAAYLADQLKAAGFAAGDIQIERHGETATLVARYRGSSGKLKPILISGHMDVVEAVGKDWTRDPFTPIVENGYVYGRGSADNKFDVSMMVATLIRLKSEGFKPKRDVILELSGDEETSQATTAILAQKLKGAELLLNGDAGGGMLDESNNPVVYGLQAAEKTYADYEISVTDPGGHSSRPGRENAIYRLAQAIDKIAAYKFPAQISDITRVYLQATSTKTPGPVGDALRQFVKDPSNPQAVATLAAEPEFVGQIGTTCVATMLSGGHALNALPQRATVNVNCRIFPGVEPSIIKAKLAEIINDPQVKIADVGTPIMSDASPLRTDVMKAIRKAIDLRAPGLAIVPNMSAGASDSLFFRNLGVPCYGVSSIFMKPSDDFSHGLNERVPVASISGAMLQWQSLIRDLSK
jgi:carboxypeptidase PM20D1